MYRILIVDDEVITRKGLMNHIHWERLNVTAVNVAAGAKEALHFLETNEVDIILSDVRMPGMNGIDMCTKIRKIAPDCQIIFLSGYSDKEYLKGAIELEAVSYVEKPISIPEVEAAIKKAVVRAGNTKAKKDELSRAVEESRTYIKATFLQKLIGGKLAVNDAKQYMDKLDLGWDSKNRFNIAIFKTGNQDADLEEYADKISIAAKCTAHVCYVKDSKYIVFLFAYTEDESQYMKQSYQNISELAKSDDRLKLNGSFGCTVSNILHTDSSYKSAAILMQQLFFYGYGKMNSYMKDVKRDEKIEVDEGIIEKYREAIEHYNLEQAEIAEQLLFDSVKEKNDVLVSHVKGLYFRFVQIVLQAAKNFRNDDIKISEAELVAYVWEKLNSLETLQECREYLREEMEEYFKNTSNLATNSKLIIEIMEYVKHNYMRPELCLNDIADNVYITPNYMNTLFKKKLGRTVGQYITDVRMTAAKELIMDRKIKLADIAEMVGYNDPGYFTKVFRKNVGINPKDYRDR